MSKSSLCLIVADAFNYPSSLDCLVNNCDQLSYTTWGAENTSWQRNLRFSTSIVIKCNDIHNDAPASLARCSVVSSPRLNGDSQISTALNWLRQHSFFIAVGNVIFDYIASLFLNHISCCISFFLKLDNYNVHSSSFAKTAAQLLLCVCASFVLEEGKDPIVRVLHKCTCDIDRFHKASSDFISYESCVRLPSVQKMFTNADDSSKKCPFCLFPLSSLLRPFVGDVNPADLESIKRFWANMVAFCVLHSARGLLPFDHSVLIAFEKHVKNGFVDVIFRSSSVFDWCISTTFPFMTSVDNFESIVKDNGNFAWSSGLSKCQLIQDLFVPTNFSRNSTWLAHCWLRGGFSSVFFDGQSGCGKSVVAQHVAASVSSLSNSMHRQFSPRCIEHVFSNPLQYFATKPFPKTGLASYLQSIHIYSVKQTHSVLLIDDVHAMPQDVHLGIRSLQQLGILWFLGLNRQGISSVASFVDISSSIVMTKNSGYDRTASINNSALIISCRDLSNSDNLKAVYSSLAHISLQHAGISDSDRFDISCQIGIACSSLQVLLQGMDLVLPVSRTISQGLQGIFECRNFLSSRNDTVRVFCHEMIHAIFDQTTIPLLDSDYASCVHSKLQSNTLLTFQSVFRTISSCFPNEDLKEMEFLTTTRIFHAHSDENVVSAAYRRCHYSAQNAIDTINVLQDSISQLFADDDSLRSNQEIDFLPSDDFSDKDCSARNCYGFTADLTNILRIVRALRCKGSHIFIVNPSLIKNLIVPISAIHCGMELFVLSSKPSLHYDRSDAISDMRQIFEAVVFSRSEVVVVLSDMHLNHNTWDVFFSAIHWVDTIGHSCFDENWMLDQSRRFFDSGLCGYTSEETISNMKTQFISNFHTIICCCGDSVQSMRSSNLSSLFFQVSLVQSTSTQNQVEASTRVASWLQQFRWDHWSSGLSLRNLYNSHSSRVVRVHRDADHPGLSSRVIALLSSLNIGCDQVESVFASSSVVELRICAERSIEWLQYAIQFLQWFLQVHSDVGVCPDYVPFSLPNDISAFCISTFNICSSIITQSCRAQALKYSIFPLSCLISLVIDTIEKQLTLFFNRLLQLEAAIRFSFECALVRVVLGPALEAAQFQQQNAASILSKFEEEVSSNDSSSSIIDHDHHAQLLAAAAQSSTEVQRLSSMIAFCENHTHISIEEMSSEAFALTLSILRIVPDTVMQQAALMVGPLVEENKLLDLLSSMNPVASDYERRIRSGSKIDFPELPPYNFELTQLLPLHALVKHSLTWTVDFSKLLFDGDSDEPASSDRKEKLPSVLSKKSRVCIKDISAFIRIASVVTHLGAGPKALPILILDPQRIFLQSFISLFSFEDICLTSVEEGHNSLAFARSVVTAVRGGLCLIVQGFSCNASIGFPKLLLNLVDKNFSCEGNGQYCLKLDPDTKAMASALGIPSSRDISIHPNFSLVLVCNGNELLGPHHSGIFKVLSIDTSHHALSCIVSNCILQEQKQAFDRYVSSIKGICNNLHLLKQNWESIVLDSAQASGNFSYGSFVFKAISEESVDEGWGFANDLCLRDSNSLINQEGLKLRLQHKLQKDQITMSIQEFCVTCEKLKVLHSIADDVAHILSYSLKLCPCDSHLMNLAACFDRVISCTHEFQSKFVPKSRTSVERGNRQDLMISSGQNMNFDDDQSIIDLQHDISSQSFSLSYWGPSLLSHIQMTVHLFIAASLSESQRLSLSLFCALHKAKAVGRMSDDEWLLLTCSDRHLQEAWTLSLETIQEASVPTSASASNNQRLLADAFARIKSRLLQPGVRSWLEAVSSASLQKLSVILPSDSSLHGLYLIYARLHAPHLFSHCIQEFVQTLYLQVQSPMHCVNEDQLLVSCSSVQATIVCTTLPHLFFKCSLVQLCPDCRNVPGCRGCVHFVIFDCRHFEGVDNFVNVDADRDSFKANSPEIVAMPGFPQGRLQSALIGIISDAVASGKGLIVLHATNVLSYWQGYLRQSSFVSNNCNSNKLSHLVLVCDSKTISSSIHSVAAWSRVIFWNFPMTCECVDAYSTGTLWLLRNLRQQELDSKKFMFEILSEGKAADSFQERLFCRITACLVAVTLSIHTRSIIQSGFLIGLQTFDAQTFFNHAVSVAVTMTKCSGLCDTKAAFSAYGIPWLRHHVVFGRGLQLATTRDSSLVCSIFDSLICPHIVNDDFTLPFLDAGIFPSLDKASELTSLLSTVSQRRYHTVEALPSISFLNLQDWNRIRYCWIQGLLFNCFTENHEDFGISLSPQLFLSIADIIQMLQRFHVALPSIEIFSNLDCHNKPAFGCCSNQIKFTAVFEVKLFILALKKTFTLIRGIHESLARRSLLSSDEETDFLFLRCNNAPERWCKLFGSSRTMRVPEFIANVNQVASFWSSWPAHASTVIPVLQTNCYRNFGRVLHSLALQQATVAGCTLSDIKCLVLPEANEFCGAENSIRVQGLIGRGFVWNGRLAMPMADLQAVSEEPPMHLKRPSPISDTFNRRSSSQLVPLGEVTILVTTPQQLQECVPFSVAKLRSIPVLRDGIDSHEADEAPFIWFIFNRETKNNTMCVFC